MRCVKCDGQLRPVTLGDVEVDRCDRCSGIWFDVGELAKILDSDSMESLKSQVDRSRDRDTQKGKCPRCGGTGNMVQVTSLRDADIHIDTCSVCYGQWLDGGELEGLSDQGFIAKIKSLFK